MTVRWVLQHVGTGHYLAVLPSLNQIVPTYDQAEAAHMPTKAQADAEWDGLHEFKRAYTVLAIEVEMQADVLRKMGETP